MPISKLFSPDTKCECKKATLFAYEAALRKCHVMPLHENTRNTSINGLIVQMNDFGKLFEKPNVECTYYCNTDYAVRVESVQTEGRAYFDGLCLDCMDLSNLKTHDEDSDYWYHRTIEVWDRGCRIRHGEPTWYFSFMGRRDPQKGDRKAMGRQDH